MEAQESAFMRCSSVALQRRFHSCERTVGLPGDQVEPVVLQAVLLILVGLVGGTEWNRLAGFFISAA